MTRNQRPARLAVAALAGLVAACGPEIPQPKPLPPPPPPSAVDQAVAAEETTTVAYVYSPVGKRDPFLDPVAGAGARAVVPTGPRGPVTALQKFEIDQLKVKFTVTGTSSPMAMIIDKEGKGHMVKIGDWVGKNWGKVSHIGREEVTVTETIADQQTGRVYPVYIPLRMPKTDQEERAERALDTGSPL